MTSSIIRARHLITHSVDRHHYEQIDDGAVLQTNGIIEEIGSYDDIAKRHPDLVVIGDGRHVVMPGFVNGHHHVGLTPVQLGSPDMPLELWWVTRIVSRSVDTYLDTLYSAFEMVASGVTTVQHLHGWLPGGLREVEAGTADVTRAYDDIGMRVSYSFAVRDQNRLVYMDDDAFVASLPSDLQPAAQRHFDRFGMDLDDFMALFESLHDRHQGSERVRIQLAPANLHWCSDDALERLAECSKRYDAPMHMHVLETAYQKEYARRRGGGTAIDYLDRFGMLGPRMTLGHGVWLSEADIDRVAETGTNICHNCSSNFRLRSGLGALNVWEKKGVNVAIGMDEAGINDDRDMLQEMRMVLKTHRTPGMDDSVPTSAQVFRMATHCGATTTPFGSHIGSLEVGRAADLVMIDWNQVSYPYLDPETSVLDAVMHRAKTKGVDYVMVAGNIIYQDGIFTGVDREAALEKLRSDLDRALTDSEVERRGLAKALLPHVKKIYDEYFDATEHVPFYKQSSRV